MLQDADLLSGVGGRHHTSLDKDYLPLPHLDDGEDVVDDPVEELDGDEQSITNKEIDELLSDAQEEVQGVLDVVEDDEMPPIIPHDDAEKSDDKDDDMVQNCNDDGSDGSDQDNRSASTLDYTPSLVSELGVRRSERANRVPERYDPSSGESYIQVCHTTLCHK